MTRLSPADLAEVELRACARNYAECVDTDNETLARIELKAAACNYVNVLASQVLGFTPDVRFGPSLPGPSRRRVERFGPGPSLPSTPAVKSKKGGRR